ncbi:Lipase 3 [Orchesella cincta]|uniref:Lipase 3 n=1 Tax=Orchesella cincta TaxID=48709 RepID=A0A1D2MC63_ORCCI|nr:Lipase 3 [Orchesella cincta]
MGHKTSASYFGVLVILFCCWWFLNLDQIGKCAQYRPYQLRLSYHRGEDCSRRSKPIFDNLSTLEEIQLRGYNASNHKILSEDGYISNIIRISGSFTSPPKGNKPSVLVFHGLAGSSAHWIMQPDGRNLAFTLVNSGYDVWLAGLRGSSSSTEHTRLDSYKDHTYWNFNMNDIATKDLPLFLELIKNETENEQVYFACHSSGCAIWLAGLAELPQLNERFKAGFLLAPALHIGAMYNPIAMVYSMIFETRLDHLIFKLFKGKYDSSSTEISKALGITPEKLCRDWSFLRCGICDNLHFFLYGNDEAQLDYENLPNIVSKLHDNMPEGMLRHQIHNKLSCKFNKFDYGKERNKVEYGSSEPPTYNLEGVRVPVYIFYAESDNMITKVDVEKTRDEIPAHFMRGFYQVEWPLFTHVDFLMAKDADILVYNKILNIMNKSESQEKHETRFGFGRRKCAAYRPANTIQTILAFNGKECRRKVEVVKESISIPILPKANVKISTVAELQLQGYSASTHTILSEDGYYTTVFRISGSITSPPRKGKQSVLLFHGLGSSGRAWIIQPGNRNLANSGYEVWLANGRGSSQSLGHTHLNANKDLSYWNFSFEEMGTKDLPPLIDLMLKETGTEKVYYVCHSAGCAAYLAGLSEIANLNEKFKAGFLLAPSAYMGGAYGPTAKLAQMMVGTPMERVMFSLFRGRLNVGPGALARRFGVPSMENFCSWTARQCGLCATALFASFGADPLQLNFTDISNIIEKGGDNNVLRVFYHLGQNLLSCGFRKYDYGRRKNLIKYGSTQPPTYNLDKMTVPTYIFYGESDNLVTPMDAKRTRDAIPAKYMRGFYQVKWSLFNHMDFLSAVDADILVYHQILDTILALDAG